MTMRTLIGVMGPGEGATARDVANARELGALIAREGWVLLTGGRAAGVMDAAAQGAKEAGGLTVGILPGPDVRGASRALDIAIPTGLGSARNNVNVLASAAMVACGMGRGTASEVSLALKAGKPVVLLGLSAAGRFFQELGGDRVSTVSSAAGAVKELRKRLAP
jgi:uncharacterized protein (TIGR00725 family)